MIPKRCVRRCRKFWRNWIEFTYDVKQEISGAQLDDRQARAQLAALLLVKATLHMNSHGTYLSFQVENASVAKHVWLLVKRLYTVEPRLAVLRKMRLKKNNIYRIVIEQGASRILEDLGILDDRGLHVKPDYDLIRSEKNARAFLQGCFLASGSVNSPGPPIIIWRSLSATRNWRTAYAGSWTAFSFLPGSPNGKASGWSISKPATKSEIFCG